MRFILKPETNLQKFGKQKVSKVTKSPQLFRICNMEACELRILILVSGTYGFAIRISAGWYFR